MTGAVERPEFLKCHNCAKEMDSKLVKFFSCLKCTAIDSCEPHICCANCVISDHWGHETVVPLGQFYANQQAAILERTRAVFDEKIKEKFAVVEELTVVLNSLKSSVPVIVQTYNQVKVS